MSLLYGVRAMILKKTRKNIHYPDLLRSIAKLSLPISVYEIKSDVTSIFLEIKTKLFLFIQLVLIMHQL